MMEFKLPDNTKIRVVVSDTHTGPNKEYGQRVGIGIWYSIDDAEYVMSEHRAMHKIVDWITLCDNLEDFLEGEYAARAR